MKFSRKTYNEMIYSMLKKAPSVLLEHVTELLAPRLRVVFTDRGFNDSFDLITN